MYIVYLHVHSKWNKHLTSFAINYASMWPTFQNYMYMYTCIVMSTDLDKDKHMPTLRLPYMEDN